MTTRRGRVERSPLQNKKGISPRLEYLSRPSSNNNFLTRDSVQRPQKPSGNTHRPKNKWLIRAGTKMNATIQNKSSERPSIINKIQETQQANPVSARINSHVKSTERLHPNKPFSESLQGQKFKKEFQYALKTLDVRKEEFVEYDVFKTLLDQLQFIDGTRKYMNG